MCPRASCARCSGTGAASRKKTPRDIHLSSKKKKTFATLLFLPLTKPHLKGKRGSAVPGAALGHRAERLWCQRVRTVGTSTTTSSLSLPPARASSPHRGCLGDGSFLKYVWQAGPESFSGQNKHTYDYCRPSTGHHGHTSCTCTCAFLLKSYVFSCAIIIACLLLLSLLPPDVVLWLCPSHCYLTCPAPLLWLFPFQQHGAGQLEAVLLYALLVPTANEHI